MGLAEQLVAQARARRPRRMGARERTVLGASALCFVAAATSIAWLVSSDRPTDPLLICGLIGGYALVSRVRFEFGNGYVVPEQLVFVPMLLLIPLEYVPFSVAAASLLAVVPDLARGSWHRDQWMSCLADSWSFVAPVVVLAALAPGEPRLDLVGVYALALLAQMGGDLLWSVVRNRLVDGMNARETVSTWAGTARVDGFLSPIAFLVALPAVDEPAALLAVAPLVWLLDIFSGEREERYGTAVELQRAYRGTVMLLSDVVEFDDPYTAHHSRSIVDLVHAVGGELGFNRGDLQELEFAALLHDVGKISIPKEILNKPAKLTEQEFEVMKTHTIEGQFMLDRVGGLLGRIGEIIRSCHERWDGAGYPDGLKGDEIPLASRIVFACDAYNAMTTDRPYRAAMSRREALDELAANAGSQFDPQVVTALTKTVEEGEPLVAPVDEVRAVLSGSRGRTRVGAAV